jgi:hypothetical protein
MAPEWRTNLRSTVRSSADLNAPAMRGVGNASDRLTHSVLTLGAVA